MINSKKILTLVLAVVMLLQSFGLTGFAADISDYKDFPTNSWSTEAMTAAVDNGLINGTSEDTIEPRKNLTRAEFAAIVTRAFGATVKADISNFKDVDADKWFADPIAKVVQMGVMNGTGNTTFAPDAFMRREDVILALARVLFVDGDDTSVLNQFSDREEIDSWSVKAIAGMVGEGYVNGYEDGTIRPQNYITREELAQLFHNMFKTYISEDCEFNSVAKKGSVVVRSKYVTLKDVTIDGDLIMADGIGDGDFRISNVHVTGKIIARGGEGMNYFVKVTSEGKVIVNDPNGTVNFYNYRDEDTPFKGGNVIENTPATFLERAPVTGGGVSGTTSKYSLSFFDADENVISGYGVSNKKGSYKIQDTEVPSDADMYRDGYIFQGWAKQGSVEVKQRDYFVNKSLSSVKGDWYPVYVEIFDEYTITFVTPDGEVPLTKTEGETITSSEIPAVDYDDLTHEFAGWTTVDGSTNVDYTNDDLTSDVVENVFSSTDVKLYPVIKEKDVTEIIFKHPDGDVKVTKYNEPDYVLTDSDVPADPSKADHSFEGWAKNPEATEGEDRSYFVGKKISDVEGTWYPIFKKIVVTYKVSFKYNDGTQALPEVEKTLSASEDYTLDSGDVYDVAHPTAPADYKFIGWSEVANGTSVVPSADLEVSVRDLDGKTFYAQFEKVTDNYTVVFKYTDGTEIGKVEKTLSSSEDYTLNPSDVSDVDYHTNPADYTFLGWTDTVDGTDYKTSAELQTSIKSLDGKTYYAQFERNETKYTVSFKFNDGSEALPTVEKNLVASEDYTLDSGDVYDVAHPTAPADYKFIGWSEVANGTSVVPSADLEVSVRDLDGKTFYAQFEKVTDNYTVVFKYTDGTEIGKVEKTLSASEDYTLTSSDVSDVDFHTNPGDYTFLGWTDTVDGTDYKTSVELRTSIKTLDGKTFYAQYARNEATYKVEFKYNDGTQAIAPVEKTLLPSEDYTLDSGDVYDVAHPTAPADYKFIGWSEVANGTSVVPSTDLEVSVRDLDGKTFYAQFEKVTDNYTVVFKYTDGTEIGKVEMTLSSSEDYTLTPSDVSDVDFHTNPADYTFLGWTDTVDGTDYKTSAELQTSIKTLDGKTYYAQFERAETTYKVEFKFTDGSEALPTVEKNLVASEDYTLSVSDVYDVVHPTAPADYNFLGWTTTVDGTDYKTSAELRTSIKTLDTVYYAQFERDETTYSVSFKYNDGSEALPTVEKNLVASEDYTLNSGDVYDVAHPTSPADHAFIGWAESPYGAVVVPSADLEVSVRELDGKTFYAQFEEIEVPVSYKVEFKYTNGNEALPTVEKSLLAAEDYTLTVSDVYDVEYFETPELYEFLGWTTTVDGSDYKTSAELQVSIKTLGTVYYAQFKNVEEVLYNVEHYFEQLDGTYVLETTESLYEYPGTDVTATALATLPEGYEGENTTHADRVAEGVVTESPVLTLKLFYDLKVLTVTYYELGDVAYTYDDGTEMIYEVKYGGTIDNFCYPDEDFDAAVNDDIKSDIAYIVEYPKIPGYGKDYDGEYFYKLFNNELGLSEYYEDFGEYAYEHEINYKWYVKDSAKQYVEFENDHVFTEDLDIYSKVKKLDVVISFPDKLTTEKLTINVPYEESTRFLDSIRDALFINSNIATFPGDFGVEDLLYDKISDVGGRIFGADGFLNDEYEINDTDVFIYFYQMMGGKSSYRQWLWEEVETEVENSIGPRGEGKPRSQYESLRSMGYNQEQALYKFFEENCFGLNFSGELNFAYNRYVDSKKFINMSSNEDKFLVTVNNEFIMEKVEEKVSSLASVDSVITEYGGGRVPEGLLNRLPMHIIEDIYEPRVQRFLQQLDEARSAASANEPEEFCLVDSGIYFDVNLVEELLKPVMEFAEDSHNKAVTKAVNSNNKAAELVEKYYVDNPYTTGKAGNYGAVNYAFNPDFYVEDTDGDGLYTIRSFEDIYLDVVMPESVETIDALLWYMDPEGGSVDFGRIKNLAEENEALILALHNHPNNLLAKYAVEGLPKDMTTYWEDLLSDPEIAAAVEKLDNKVSFDMMYFVESKIQNATLEMYYLKVLDKVGVPAESILSKYTNSKAYKELTSEDFNKLLSQLDECWATVEVDVDGVMMAVENANGTTDYVFDNVLEKVGSSGNVAQAAIKGFEVKITRFFADTVTQTYEEANS